MNNHISLDKGRPVKGRESVEFQNYDSQDVESYPNTQPHRLMCSYNVKDMFFYGGTEVVKFDVFLYTNCVRVCSFKDVEMHV